MARVVGLVSMMCLVLLAVAVPARAHTELSSSDPANGETVDGPLDTLTLTFSRPIELAGKGVQILDASGCATATSRSRSSPARAIAVARPGALAPRPRTCPLDTPFEPDEHTAAQPAGSRRCGCPASRRSSQWWAAGSAAPDREKIRADRRQVAAELRTLLLSIEEITTVILAGTPVSMQLGETRSSPSGTSQRSTSPPSGTTMAAAPS
ncbi:MAG: copper resistance protein CopC [Actinobacteria bacterium]|nr:copper resistance protein CopC [Actinomycetota bacterium]